MSCRLIFLLLFCFVLKFVFCCHKKEETVKKKADPSDKIVPWIPPEETRKLKIEIGLIFFAFILIPLFIQVGNIIH